MLMGQQFLRFDQHNVQVLINFVHLLTDSATDSHQQIARSASSERERMIVSTSGDFQGTYSG